MKRFLITACLMSLLLCACDDDDSFVAKPNSDKESAQSSSSGKKVSSSSSLNKDSSSSSSSKKETSSSSSSVKDESASRYPEDRDLDIPAVVKGCKTEDEDNCDYGILRDERDGQLYRTIKIGEQEWTAENMNYNDGVSPCYNIDSSNCEKYGRLYEWSMATRACPEGWSLPTPDEWYTLFDEAGGRDVAGYVLKSTEGWGYDGNGIDAFGFSMLPAGHCLGATCREAGRDFSGLGSGGDFWTSEDKGSGNSHEAIRCYPYYLQTSCYWLDTDYRFSVRCIKREGAEE